MLTSMVDAQRKTYKEFDALIDKRLSELDATMPSISVFDIDGTVFLSTTSRLVPTINLHVIGMCNKLRRAPHNNILFLTARKQSPATTAKTLRANGILEQLGFDDDAPIIEFGGCCAVESPGRTPILVVTMVGLGRHAIRHVREGRFKRLVISQLSNLLQHLQPVVAVGDREHDVGMCRGDFVDFNAKDPFTVSRFGFIGYVIANVNKGDHAQQAPLPAQVCQDVDRHASIAVASVIKYIVGRSREAPIHSRI